MIKVGRQPGRSVILANALEVIRREQTSFNSLEFAWAVLRHGDERDPKRAVSMANTLSPSRRLYLVNFRRRASMTSTPSPSRPMALPVSGTLLVGSGLIVAKAEEADSEIRIKASRAVGLDVMAWIANSWLAQMSVR
jgi:hypothetical protein